MQIETLFYNWKYTLILFKIQENTTDITKILLCIFLLIPKWAAAVEGVPRCAWGDVIKHFSYHILQTTRGLFTVLPLILWELSLYCLLLRWSRSCSCSSASSSRLQKVWHRESVSPLSLFSNFLFTFDVVRRSVQSCACLVLLFSWWTCFFASWNDWQSLTNKTPFFVSNIW